MIKLGKSHWIAKICQTQRYIVAHIIYSGTSTYYFGCHRRGAGQKFFRDHALNFFEKIPNFCTKIFHVQKCSISIQKINCNILQKISLQTGKSLMVNVLISYSLRHLINYIVIPSKYQNLKLVPLKLLDAMILLVCRFRSIPSLWKNNL